MSNQQSLREYLVSRIAELRKQATSKPKHQSFAFNRAIMELEKALTNLDNTIKQVEVMTPFKTFETKGKNWIWKGEVLELLKGKTCPACNTNHTAGYECANAHGSWE